MVKKKKLMVCGCSFMTSSYQQYLKLKGPDWPDQFPITKNDIDQLPAFVREELNRFDYTHWPSFLDLYARYKDYEIMYLAQGGENNLTIRMQVDQAVELSADYVIIAATDWNRDMVNNKESLAYKMYLTEIYDSENKKINDYYILQSALALLEKHSIPYVFIPNLMKELNWNDYNIVWPENKEQPWFKPVVKINMNHVAFAEHEEMYETLLALTERW